MEIEFSKKNKNHVNDAIKGKKSYKKLTAAEWHQFVQNYNYDDGNEPFEWLVKQKICDKGTALCLYWHLQPDFYCNSGNKEIISDNDYLLIKEIEKRFLDQFYETELFLFDPKTEFLTSKTNVSCIPWIMQEKTNGIPFEKVSVEYAFLRNPDEKELKIIEKNIKDAILILLKTNQNFIHKDINETIDSIEKSVEYWKNNELGKIKPEKLSFLWLDCLREKYNWNWIVWDWETGKAIGCTNKSRSLTCISNTLIKHTIGGFKPVSIISELFNDLNGIEKISEMKQNPYTGIGLLFSSEHLEFRE